MVAEREGVSFLYGCSPQQVAHVPMDNPIPMCIMEAVIGVNWLQRRGEGEKGEGGERNEVYLQGHIQEGKVGNRYALNTLYACMKLPKINNIKRIVL